MAELTQSSTPGQGAPPDRGYVMTPRGMLKIAQAVLSLIAFICAMSVWWFEYHGGGFVAFMGIACCILTIIQIVFNVMMLYQRFPNMPYMILGLVYYGLSAVLFFIAMIIAAVKAVYHPAVAAAAVFSAFCAVLYGVDFVLDFLAMRAGGGIRTLTTTTTTTTTTKTSNEPI